MKADEILNQLVDYVGAGSGDMTLKKAKQAIEACIAERVTQKLKYINHFDDSELRSALDRELKSKS